jgi:hypothetical protein
MLTFCDLSRSVFPLHMVIYLRGHFAVIKTPTPSECIFNLYMTSGLKAAAGGCKSAFNQKGFANLHRNAQSVQIRSLERPKYHNNDLCCKKAELARQLPSSGFFHFLKNSSSESIKITITKKLSR